MEPIPETQMDQTLVGATAALHRAARRARMIARRTGTPLVFGKNGRVEKRLLEGNPAAAFHEDFLKYGTDNPDTRLSGNDRAR